MWGWLSSDEWMFFFVGILIFMIVMGINVCNVYKWMILGSGYVKLYFDFVIENFEIIKIVICSR